MRITTWLVLLATAIGGFLACDRGSTPTPTEVPNQWQAARTTPGHTAHLGKAFEGRTIACNDCHEEKEGFKSPGVTPCAKCHAENAKTHHQGSKEKPTTCLTCHAFSAADGGKAPSCTDCHSGEHANPAHKTAGASCTSCHAPHREPRTVLANCTECHSGVGVKHGSFTVTATSDAGADAITEAKPPREAGIPAGDADIADIGAIAATHGGVCSSCHAPHTVAAEAKNACATCHVAEPTAKGTVNAWLATQAPHIKPSPPKVASHESCTTCHQPHAATKGEVLACAGCHANKTGVAAVKGHGTCTGCHLPHAPNNAPLACESCHKGHDALAASKVAAHDKCTSCHSVHTPTATAAAKCESCHSKVHPTHPSAPAKNETQSACIGCHAPHPAKSTVIASTCTSCHNNAAADNKLHAGAVCSSCHKQHDFKLVSTPALCSGCHATQAAKVQVPGHTFCTSCHGAVHTPQKDVACGKCHGKEAATAPKGHDKCRACHESHSGGLFSGGKPISAAAICGTCHADKQKTHHGNVPGGCGSCHRAHGPAGPASPPACTSCHAKSKPPSLHATPAHAANCTTCHSGHTPVHADRATCTSTCHLDRQNHQPAAKVCTGCHIFGK